MRNSGYATPTRNQGLSEDDPLYSGADKKRSFSKGDQGTQRAWEENLSNTQGDVLRLVQGGAKTP